MNIRFRMQNRSTLNLNDGRDDTVEGVVRRLRLRFDGFVGNPKFLYAIQLSFSPGDVGTLRDGDGINIIRDAMFFYRPNPRINLGFGQTKLPGNRQRLNSSGALQLTDPKYQQRPGSPSTVTTGCMPTTSMSTMMPSRGTSKRR